MTPRHLLAALAAAAALSFGPAAARAQHVVTSGGDSIVLSSGADAGVRKGMTGRICMLETVGGRTVTNCSALFVVTSVSKEKSIAHVTKGDSNIAAGTPATFDERLSPPREEKKPPPKKREPPPKRDEATTFLQDADRAFRDGDYRGALERYQNFLRAYPNHDRSDFAAERAEQCRAKIGVAPAPPAAVQPKPPAPDAPPPAMPAAVPLAVPPPPPIPAGLREGEDLAVKAEGLFQRGELGEARASALEALRSDSTNPRARATLRAVQIKSVQSRFNAPTDVAISGALCYVADAGNNTVRLIRTNATTTVAGASGQYGYADGPPPRARFNEPNGIAIAQNGTVYVADRYNSTVRAIAPDGTARTVAGRSGLTGTADGAGSSARFSAPRRVAAGPDGSIYVADTGNHSVRKISPAGVVETVATLSGSERMDPIGITLDRDGNVLIADAWSHVIRRLDTAGHLTIVAGLPGVSGSVDGPVGSARFNAPEGVGVDADGSIYVADTANHTIRKIANGLVTTVAGAAGVADAVDGSGPLARLNRPSGICCDKDGRLWIADSGNHVVRLMTAGFVETIAGLPGEVGSSDGAN